MLYREIIAVSSEIYKKAQKCSLWADSRMFDHEIRLYVSNRNDFKG